jgi:hypothetical protein
VEVLCVRVIFVLDSLIVLRHSGYTEQHAVLLQKYEAWEKRRRELPCSVLIPLGLANLTIKYHVIIRTQPSRAVAQIRARQEGVFGPYSRS